MADCIWTTLVHFVESSINTENEKFSTEKSRHLLYDRMLNVFGWTTELRIADKAGREGKQSLKYTLHRTDIRNKRHMLCCMINKQRKMHDCAVFQMVSTAAGEYESAIKAAKADIIAKIHAMYIDIVPYIQSPIEGTTGEDEQTTMAAENTEVTEDIATEEAKTVVAVDDFVSSVASTEKEHQFCDLFNRWVPLDNLTIDSTTTWPIKRYNFPEDLYKLACVSNTLPMEQFMYGFYDIDVMVKVNANKFQAGRLIVSVVPAPVLLCSTYLESWYNAVQRTHAFIDVAAATAARVNVPFEYNRAYVRNIEHGQNCAGIDGAKYGAVEIGVASPIAAGSGQSKDISILVWVKISKAKLAGMALRVPIIQGPIMRPIEPFLNMLKAADVTAEVLLDGFGDKPTVLNKNVVTIPNPNFGWCNGKGLAFCDSLRLDPSSRVTFPGRCASMISHNSVWDIARQWGYLTSFSWSTSTAVGSELVSIPLEPAFWANPTANTNSFASVVSPPVSIVSRFMQYYSGTFEFRIEFVSTSFHSGSVTIAIEFGRESTITDRCTPYASYNKTFDLGEKKVLEFTVPYIYDTPMRRNNVIPLYAHKGLKDATVINKYRTGLMMRVNSRVYIAVANMLRAPTTVTSTIGALVYVRAGKDWRACGVVQNNGLFPGGESLDTLPSDKYQAVLPKRTKREVKTYSQVVKQEVHRGKGLGEVLDMVKVTRKEEEKTRIQTDALTQCPSSVSKDDEIKRLREELESKKKEFADLSQSASESKNKADTCADTVLAGKYKVEALFFREQANMVWEKGFQKASNTYITEHAKKLTRIEEENKPHHQQLFEGYGDEIIVQDAVVERQSPVRAGSVYWRHLFQLGGLKHNKFSWVKKETRPIAQGPGDYTTEDEQFFQPRNHEAARVLMSNNEMCIWDILRRPVMIHTSISYDGGKNYFIPVMPPQWNCINANNTVFDEMVKTSPHVALTSMYRFWRGETRYTIINRSSEVLYIGYIPHSGTRLIGEFPLNGTNDEAFTKTGFMLSGNAMTMNVPQVNPVTQIEIPSLMENLWVTMNNGGLTTNGPWRDKCDDNAGHLVIYSHKPTLFDVAWAAGDGFRMGGFIGANGQQRMRLVDTMTDDNPRTQSFIEEDEYSLRGVPSAQIFGLRMPRFITNLDMAASNINLTTEKIYQSLEKSNLALDVAKSFAIQKTEECTRLISEAMENMISSWAGSAIKTAFISFAMDVWLVWKTWNVTVLATLTAKWILSLGLVSAHMLTTLVGTVRDFIMAMCSPVTQAPGSSGDPLRRFVRSLISITSIYKSTWGNSVVERIVRRIVEGCKLLKFTWYARTWSAFVDFLSSLVSIIGNIWKWLMCEQDPEAEIMTALVERNNVFRAFITDMNDFLRVESRKELIMYPSRRIKFYATVSMSYKISNILMRSPDMKDFVNLSYGIRQLQAKANEYAEELMTCPVRYEPYVICLEGGSDIGKSFYANAIAHKLLESIGFKEFGEALYIRTPGRDYWDGYTGQPVVQFDDLCNIDEASVNVSTISELFALKSSAVFIPNMAHLEKKNMRANPLIVLILTNTPFPKMDEMRCVPAFDRRRDVMYKVSSVGDVKLPGSDHLRFQKYNTTVRTATDEYEFSPVMDRTTFEDNLIADFKAYHTREQKHVKARLDVFFDTMRQPDEKDLLNYDPYAVTYMGLYKSNFVAGGENLLEEMNRVFGEYLEKNEYASMVDMYLKREERPIAQNGEEKTPEFLYLESLPEVSELGGKAPREETVDFWTGARARFNDKDKAKAVAFFEVLQEGTYIHQKALLERTLAYLRSATGLDNGTCHCCKRDFVLVKTFPCGCSISSICVDCIVRSDVETCECGIWDIRDMKLTLFQVFWTIVYYWSRALCYPVVYVISSLALGWSGVTQIFEGYGSLMIALGTLALMTGNWMLGAIQTGIGSLVLRAVGSPNKGKVEANAKACLMAFIRASCYTMSASASFIKHLIRGNRNVEEPEEDCDPVVESVNEPCITVRQGPKCSDLAKGWTVEQLDTLCGGNTTRPCVHWDLLKPAVGLVIVGTITINGISAIPRDVEWHDGKWIFFYPDGRGGSCTNGYCQSEQCPLRINTVVTLLLRRIMRNEIFRNGIFMRLRSSYELNKVPVQLLSEGQYQASLGLWHNSLKFIAKKLDELKDSDWITALKNISQKAWVKTCWLFILGGSVLVVIFKGVVSFLNLFSSESEDTEEVCVLESQSSQSRPQCSKNGARLRSTSYTIRKEQGRPVAQGACDNLNNIMAVVYQNVVIVEVDQIGKVNYMIGLGVNKHNVIMPSHYKHYLDTARDMKRPLRVKRLQGSEAWYTITVRDSDIVMRTDTDVLMWNMDVLPPFRDITKHFASNEVLENYQIKGEAYLLVPATETLGFKVPTLHTVQLREFVKNVVSQAPSGIKQYPILNGVTYNFSMTGACGSPIIRNTTMSPLLGFHVAGVGHGLQGKGWGLVLSREELADMSSKLVPAPQNLLEYEEIPHMISHDGSGIGYPTDLACLELGMMPPRYSVVQPRKTRITESAVSLDLGIEVQRVPCPLTGDEYPYIGSGTTPLMEGIKKYGRPPIDLPGDFESVVEPILGVKLGMMPPEGLHKRPPLTLKEAICGVPELEFYDSINVASSPGYPWNLTYKGGKKEMMGIDPYFITEDVEKEFNREMEVTRKGVVPPTIFLDQLKDETKDKEKLKKLGKTRLFCMSPVTFTLRMRVFFMHFYAAFMKNRITGNHAIGINPESLEWTQLIRNLKSKNDIFVWSVDYSNFGPAYSLRAGKLSMKLMIRWLMKNMNYTEADEKAMWVIHEELAHSRHLANNCVFQQSCGSPSGSADTAIKNSMVNMTYVYYFLHHALYSHWRSLHSQKGHVGGTVMIHEFWLWVESKVYFCVYGDDLIAATAPDVIHLVNAVTFTEFYKKFDIVATDASKGELVSAYTTYDKLEFLKRGCVPHPRMTGAYLAPLPDYIVREAAYYIWEGGDLLEDTRVNCGASLVLAYTRGPEFYQTWLDIINTACESRGIRGFAVSWTDWDDHFFPPEGQGVVQLHSSVPCAYPIILCETDIERAKEIFCEADIEKEYAEGVPLFGQDKEPENMFLKNSGFTFAPSYM